jgi:hypothetical protein
MTTVVPEMPPILPAYKVTPWQCNHGRVETMWVRVLGLDCVLTVDFEVKSYTIYADGNLPCIGKNGLTFETTESLRSGQPRIPKRPNGPSCVPAIGGRLTGPLPATYGGTSVCDLVDVSQGLSTAIRGYSTRSLRRSVVSVVKTTARPTSTACAATMASMPLGIRRTPVRCTLKRS